MKEISIYEATRESPLWSKTNQTMDFSNAFDKQPKRFFKNIKGIGKIVVEGKDVLVGLFSITKKTTYGYESGLAKVLENGTIAQFVGNPSSRNGFYTAKHEYLDLKNGMIEAERKVIIEDILIEENSENVEDDLEARYEFFKASYNANMHVIHMSPIDDSMKEGILNHCKLIHEVIIYIQELRKQLGYIDSYSIVSLN